MLIIQAKGREILYRIEMDQAQLCLAYFMNILTRTMCTNSVLMIEAHLIMMPCVLHKFSCAPRVLQHNKLPLSSREASLYILYL